MPFQFLFEPFFRDSYNENTLSSDEASYSRALTARLGKRVRELGKGKIKARRDNKRQCALVRVQDYT